MKISVIGIPAPQGSKRPIGRSKSGRVLMIESSNKVAPWRDSVAWAAKMAMATTPGCAVTGPASIVIDFWLKPPAKPKKTDICPAKRPDLDKLIRSTLDALTTAGAIEDDSMVVCLQSRKRYTNTFRREPGAEIEILPWVGA